MVDQRTQQNQSVSQLRSAVQRLDDKVRRLEDERDRLIRQRRWKILAVGALVSVCLHVTFLVYLGTIYRMRDRGIAPQPVSFEFAVEQEEELTELENEELTDLLDETSDPSLVEELDMPEVELEVQPPAAELEVSSAGAIPALGGSGGESGPEGLAGGGAGTSFFGISSRGKRFAYIVDRSGSMGQQRKLLVARRELARSVESLPDFAYFYVLFFASASDISGPPMQAGWMQAKDRTVQRFIQWLNDVESGGGTEPGPAFLRIFALDVRPDVIFFLTDGEIPAETADEVAQMNRDGRRVVINTIAFGDPASQDLLKRIAEDSGGVYRFVPSGGYP
jgi:hypothetical protein